MPQGRRKTPFSGKAKKEQLKAKKQAKGEQKKLLHAKLFLILFQMIDKPKKPLLVRHSNSDDSEDGDVQKVNYQPTKSGRDNRNRYALMFHKETDEEVRERKEIARQSIEPASEEQLEINGDEYFPKELDFPKRPPWSFEMDRNTLEAKEQRYFSVKDFLFVFHKTTKSFLGLYKQFKKTNRLERVELFRIKFRNLETTMESY